MKRKTITKRILAVLLSVIMVMTLVPTTLITTFAADGSQADPFAELVQQAPEGFEKTDSPYGTLEGEAFNILKKNEILAIANGNGIHSIEAGKPQAVEQAYYHKETLHYVKAVAFDPTGSGQKDHVAYIGYNWNTAVYEVYVMNAETGMTSPRVILNEFGQGGSLFMKNLGVNSQGEFSHFHDITAGDYNGDGKETFIVHVAHWHAEHMDYELSATSLTDNSGNVTGIQVEELDRTDFVFRPNWEILANQHLNDNEAPQPKNVHGTSYATADFNRDGVDDLAILTYALDPVIPADKRDVDDFATKLTIVLGVSYKDKYTEEMMGHDGVFAFRAPRTRTDILIEQNATENPVEGTEGSAKTVAFPSVTAGDIDGDGVDEAIVSGYTVKLPYTYVMGEYEELIRRMGGRTLDTGVIVGVYNIDESEIKTKSLKLYNDINVTNPIMNNLSQVIAFCHGMPWQDPNDGKVYKYSDFTTQVDADVLAVLKGQFGYDFADFDYNGYDKPHTIIPQFKTAAVAINGSGSSEYIFLNGSLVRYDKETQSIVHEYTPEYYWNTVQSIREHITTGNAVSAEKWKDVYDYIQSVTVGSFNDDGTDREQVAVTVDSRYGIAISGTFGCGGGGYNVYPAESNDMIYLYSDTYLISGADYSDVAASDGTTLSFGKATEYNVKESVVPTRYTGTVEISDGHFQYDAPDKRARLWQVFESKSSPANHSLVAVDIGHDGLVGRYVGKEYTYADPEIIAVLQAAPYYKDLGYYGGETEYTITRSYTEGKTGSTELAWNVGFALEVETACVQSETSAGYTSGWTEEFEESIEKTYSITFTATSKNAVAMVRTPVILYRFQLMDKNGNWLPTDEKETHMTIAIPSQPVYTTVSIEEYNAYVDYYNGVVGRNVLNKIESEELLNNEGDPSKYRVNWDGNSSVDHDNGVAFGEIFNESKFNMDGSIGVSFAENQSVTEGLSKSRGFYFEETLSGGGDGGLIPIEIWAGVEAGVEKGTSYGTYSSKANGTESSGTVAHVGNATGISLDNLSNYGFTWQFGTWNLDLDSRVLDPQKDEPNTVPVFGYVVKRAKMVPNAPENLTVSTASGTESEAVKMTWDTVEGATYNVYKEVNDVYTLLASNLEANEFTYTLPKDDTALFYNFAVTAVSNEIESVYSARAIYYRTEIGSKGIECIEKTNTEGLVDTYTITFTDGSETTFTVTNGEQGIQGIQGEKGDDGHTPVITIRDGFWYIDDNNTNIRAEGLKGDTGNGISNVEKTGTKGLVDTYTITFTNGNTTTFTVTNGENGVGVEKVEKTATEGNVDTYTITLTNGNTFSFTVTNGTDGEDGLTPYIGENGNWWIGDTDTGVRALYEPCGHICHNDDIISRIIWTIVNFFQRIFGIQQYCDCGELHYH